MASYLCIIAGFYFASTTHALAVCVIGKRIRDTHTYMYYLSHGLFGSYLNYHILNYTPPLSTLKVRLSVVQMYTYGLYPRITSL